MIGGGRISAVATAFGESAASAIGAIRVGRGDSRAGVNRQRSDSQSRAAAVWEQGGRRRGGLRDGHAVGRVVAVAMIGADRMEGMHAKQ